MHLVFLSCSDLVRGLFNISLIVFTLVPVREMAVIFLVEFNQSVMIVLDSPFQIAKTLACTIKIYWP